MHKEVLDKAQIAVLPMLKKFNDRFFLAGGTAIALQLGHRKSIDFDLFTNKKVSFETLESSLKAQIQKILVRTTEELTVMIHGVKVTFLKYPFTIAPKVWFENIIKMPDLLDLAAMKAYTLGRRNELKDYVDLYFLLKKHFTIEQIEQRAREIFGTLFSEKLLRVQLVYFDGINWNQHLEMLDSALNFEEMKRFLEKLIRKSF